MYSFWIGNLTSKMSSSFVAASLAICLTGLLLYFILTDERYLAIAAFGFAMMVPLSVMFSPAKYKYSFVIYAAAMAVIGVFAIILTFAHGDIFNSLTTIFILGFLGFQWVANYLLIKEGNR
jgi:hypothetical protein